MGKPRGAERSAEGYYFCQQIWITRVFHVRVMCQESASILQMYFLSKFLTKNNHVGAWKIESHVVSHRKDERSIKSDLTGDEKTERISKAKIRKVNVIQAKSLSWG